jgi:ubiquinone/menaquinone biosynthesis C-methylase UbiE
LERREYDKLNALEDEMWWFRGNRANLLTAFRARAERLPSGAVLDAGCGTGGLLATLARELPEWQPIGLDADALACAVARDKSSRPVCAGSANAMPVADRSLAAIFSADVLCHGKIDESLALAEFHRCLAVGGLLVMNLPSYQWLLSAHDHAVHNVRRYTQRRVRALLHGAGFAKIRMTYWNTILFPLMVLRRFVARRPDVSDVMPFPAPIETAFRGIMRIENGLLGHGIRLPFGGSLLATAIRS